MDDCNKCRGTIRGETGIRCAGVCKKTFHFSTKCSGLDSYSSNILNSVPMLRFICDECMGCITDVSEILFKVQQNLEASTTYLSQFKHVLDDALQSNRTEIKLLLEAVESTFGERLKSLSSLHESCKQTICDMKEVSEVAVKFSNHSEAISNQLEKFTANIDVISNMDAGINKLTVKSNSKTLYSEVVKKNPVVMIKPKKTQTSKLTKEDVKKAIDPVNFNLGGIVERNDGNVVIICDDENTTKNISETAANKLSENYNIVVPKEINPKILIVGITEKYEKEEIIKMIVKQNIITAENQIKIVRIYKNKKNEFNAIVEINTEDYKKIMEMGKIKIGWDRCKVYESFDVRRCYNCLGFGHKKEKCTVTTITCLKCGDQHLAKDCVMTTYDCINCKRANTSLNLQLDTKHNVFDKHCPSFLRKLVVEKKKIFR